MCEGKSIWKEGINPEEMLFFLGNKKKPNLFHFFIKVQIISKEKKKLQLICIASFTEIHGDPAIKICVEEME